MCTAIKYRNIHGRNLDLEFPVSGQVVISGKKFDFKWRHLTKDTNKQVALIGMAMVVDNYPLYFDAMNEYGLFAAGLNFVGYGQYFNVIKGKKNICSFEVIPYILKNCKTVDDAKKLLKDINITNDAFNKSLPPSPLHWQVSDKKQCIVIESTPHGLNVYDNPYNALANAPEFSYHSENFKRYMNLSAATKDSNNFNGLVIKPNSNGLGGISLPGGLCSHDRFIRAAFTTLCSISNDNEMDNVSQFFHILKSVSQTRGQVISIHDAKLHEITIYSAGISADTLTYYYNTYENSQINAISLKSKNVNLNSDQLFIYDLNKKQNINFGN